MESFQSILMSRLSSSQT